MVRIVAEGGDQDHGGLIAGGLGGALFLGFIAIVPFVAGQVSALPSATSILSSTSLLIMVGVALDTMRQLESQLLMRNYEGFIR